MKRKIEIVFFTIIFIAAAAFLFLMKEGRSPAEKTIFNPRPGNPKDGLLETTIRNITKGEISYHLVPFASTQDPVEHSLEPGEIDRILTSVTLHVSFEHCGKKLTRTLDPGIPYSFRYDENYCIQIYEGSHGREDAEDLAPFVATPMNVVLKMLELAEVNRGDLVYDLGCGDGRIVITAAKEYGARGFGIDIDPQRIYESREAAIDAGVQDMVEFRIQDATRTDISAATKVLLYLLPESNEILRPKFEEQLRPGVIVVTHNYHIPGWDHKQVTSLSLEDEFGQNHSIFVYKR
jgi:2-polyprenyl-3-methyl-5-hydroxy-6-metoxy-1,4-benzoquinol methylase